jgi:hypothetical protein
MVIAVTDPVEQRGTHASEMMAGAEGGSSSLRRLALHEVVASNRRCEAVFAETNFIANFIEAGIS